MNDRDLGAFYRAQQDNIRECVEIEDAIARHPEYIADVFAESVIGAPLPPNVAGVAKIERVEQCSGTWNQGGRGKNIVPWSGYRYRIKGDPVEYWTRSGGNWCSSLYDWGEHGKDDGPDIDLNILTPFSNERKKVLARICEMETKAAVAYLLQLVIGV